MDFASWSPSHTILVLFMIGGFIGQVAILFYRTGRLEKRAERLEKRADRTDEQIDKQGEMFFHALERLEDRMDKRFVEVISHMNQQGSDLRGEIRDLRLEMSKLNQNHIDHLTHHHES